ncbi:uncharacterized protein LOC115244161, partial [Formica exsecta]|uniref:uncharacterized protein LOC115244161 n=1 Tax=Formica exsecta TaxID=72781 RepID=UPI0011432C3A
RQSLYFFQSSITFFTGALSSIYGIYCDPNKECLIERFPQDTPKYVALKDLFLSQDKDVTSIINCKQPYESFYDFGLSTDYSFIEGNNRENATRNFDTIKETNYIGHELDSIYTKNKTDIDDLRLDIKFPLYNCDGVYNVENDKDSIKRRSDEDTREEEEERRAKKEMYLRVRIQA